jgi:hypothetical protein
MITACTNITTIDGNNKNQRVWFFYKCARCGGVITASAAQHGAPITELFPSSSIIDENIPERVKAYLIQAIQSIHAPAGALMLAASSVDAMMKNKGYKEGSLYSRINKAFEDHLITEDMAKWAHEVRLDSNDQRHADEDSPLPTQEDAKRCVEFAQTLAQILFVIPARVRRGLESVGNKSTDK